MSAVTCSWVINLTYDFLIEIIKIVINKYLKVNASKRRYKAILKLI